MFIGETGTLDDLQETRSLGSVCKIYEKRSETAAAFCRIIFRRMETQLPHLPSRATVGGAIKEEVGIFAQTARAACSRGLRTAQLLKVIESAELLGFVTSRQSEVKGFASTHCRKHSRISHFVSKLTELPKPPMQNARSPSQPP